jgi:hypothetical protein
MLVLVLPLDQIIRERKKDRQVENVIEIAPKTKRSVVQIMKHDAQKEMERKGQT